MAASNKRPVSEDKQNNKDHAASSQSTPTATPPKRPRLAPKHLSDDPPHLSLNNPMIVPPILKAPLTPQTPSRFLSPTTAANTTGPKGKSTRKATLASNTINTTIYSLRKQGLAWDDIATRTNATCALDESAACYSRFFRNGPLVARARGEVWERESYVGMTGPVGDKVLGGAGEVGGGEVGDGGRALEGMVREALEETRGEFWKRLVEVVNGKLVAEGKEVVELEEVQEVYDRVVTAED